MINHIKITTKGIKSILKKCKYPQAIDEYVWNGFDAGANLVEIFYEANALGTITGLKIVDNGSGISQKKLEKKFSPFYESEKSVEMDANRNHSTNHGKNGVGRLTFFTFATTATWDTCFEEDGKRFKYEIIIEAHELEKFVGLDSKVIETKESTGTTVRFDGIVGINKTNFDEEIYDHLQKEFCWFIELNKHKNLSLKINGKPLDYSEMIGDTEDISIKELKTGNQFNIHYVRWNEKLPEYSKYYYLNSKKDEQWKEYTTLNNKGDQFFHSLYIESAYFNNFNFEPDQNDSQEALLGGTRSDDSFKFLQEQLSNYLRKKRKPFIKKYADRLIAEYEKEGVLPSFKEESWDQLRKSELKDVIRGLYEVQPKIFTSFNLEQKKTFVGFLNLILDSEEREKLMDIIKQVVELDSDEINELWNLIKITHLSRISKTIEMVKERYKVIDQLKELLFNKEMKADEPNHIQKLIEEHYWIFGEEYHLVTAAEPKFEEALRRHIYLLRGEKKNVVINHPHKNKEMDVFLCRWDKGTDRIRNIVVELKNPSINLGEQELSQVKKYMSVIFNEDEFNAPNMEWTFYLIGNDFDTSGFIKNEIANSRHHGEESLVFKADNYKIYVKKWSEVFTTLECRHNFINEKLGLERDKLSKKYSSAEEIMGHIKQSEARETKKVAAQGK